MFDKVLFKDILEKAIGGRKIAEFAELCNVTRPYLSKYLNLQLENAPSPEILRKIASQARNGITYFDLMKTTGYFADIPEINEDYFPDIKVKLTSPVLVSVESITDYVHVVTDDSMMNLSIRNGDYLNVKKQDYAENGDIILVKTSTNETLIRQYHKVNNIIVLNPANDSYEPLAFINSKFADSITIVGRVESVTHKF